MHYNMSDETLKISVVTVCYNSAATLEKTILSVLNQSYPHIEYIVIDGGSTDGTVDIIKKYADRLAHWVSESDKGMYDALVKGFSKITGDVCCWLNADDMLYEAAFDTVSDFFEQNPEIDWLTGYNVCYNKSSQITSVTTPIVVSNRLLRTGFYQSAYRVPFIQQESTFWRKSLLDKLDFNRFSSFRLAGDYYMWYTFAQHSQLLFITSYLGGWRRIEGQLSSDLKTYAQEVASFTQKKTPFDYLHYFVDFLLYYFLKGSSLYRRIYRKKMHHWSISQSRFV